MPEIIEIARFSSEFEARVALAHLTSEGIRAEMVTDDAGGAFPNLSMLTGGVRLIVRNEDVRKAESALEMLRDEDGRQEA